MAGSGEKLFGTVRDRIQGFWRQRQDTPAGNLAPGWAAMVAYAVTATNGREIGGTDEQGKQGRGDSGRELDQVACRRLLGSRARRRLPAVGEAHRCGEERREGLAARER